MDKLKSEVTFYNLSITGVLLGLAACVIRVFYDIDVWLLLIGVLLTLPYFIYIRWNYGWVSIHNKEEFRKYWPLITLSIIIFIYSIILNNQSD